MRAASDAIASKTHGRWSSPAPVYGLLVTALAVALALALSTPSRANDNARAAAAAGNAAAATTQVVSIRAKANNKYVTANGSKAPLIANRAAVGTWEKFDLVRISSTDVYLRAHANGKYVSAESAGGAALISNRTAAGPWEKFQLINNSDGTKSLRARVNNRLVTAESAGAAPLIANRTAIGAWEKFVIVKLSSGTPATTSTPAPTTTRSGAANPITPQKFPDASTTGYRRATGYSGQSLPRCPAVKSNSIIRNCQTGPVDVGSPSNRVVNVTFIGVRFHGADPALVKIFGDNITFDYCTFEPDIAFRPGIRVAYKDSYQFGIVADGGWYSSVGKLTITHSDFWGFGNAIDTDGSTKENPQVFRANWVHDAAEDGGDYHTDGIGTLSGSGLASYVIVDGNTIESPGNTNGLAFQRGSYSNFTITNNLFGGFGYTVALWAPAPNTTFTGNVFSTRLKPDFGPLYPQPFWTSIGSIWRDNRWLVPNGASYGNPADNGKYWTPNGPSSFDYER